MIIMAINLVPNKARKKAICSIDSCSSNTAENIRDVRIITISTASHVFEYVGNIHYTVSYTETPIVSGLSTADLHLDIVHVFLIHLNFNSLQSYF